MSETSLPPTITEIRDHALMVLERRGLEMPPPDPEERVRMLAAWTSLSEACLWLTYSEYRDGRKWLGVGRHQNGRLSHMLFGVEWLADEPPTAIEDCEFVLGPWIDEVMGLAATPADDFGGVLGLPSPRAELLSADDIRRRPGGGWKASGRFATTAITERKSIISERRLPDFIFGRAHAIEQEAGYVLAGTLVTDIAKTGRMSKRDHKLIARIIKELAAAAQRDPALAEAGIWRRGSKPADGLAPPFDDAMMRERCQRCICVAVRVDPGSDQQRIKLDSDLLRQIGIGPDGRPLQ